jgi:hypothetical protein
MLNIPTCCHLHGTIIRELNRSNTSWNQIVHFCTQPVIHHHHHHQVILLLVEHRASMKSFQALQSSAIPLTSFHDLPVHFISSSIVLRHYTSTLQRNIYILTIWLINIYISCVREWIIWFYDVLLRLSSLMTVPRKLEHAGIFSV